MARKRHFKPELVFVFLIFFSIIQTCFSTLSGLYIDNGFDQTVIQRVMSVQEKQQVEHEILDLLGLPNRPRRKHHVPIKKSAPKFLLDIYKSLAEEQNTRSTRSSELNLSGDDLHAIDESDVIMTFQSHNHHSHAIHHERGKRLWFDVSEVQSQGEDLAGAELRLYQTSNFVEQPSNHHHDRIFAVSAYQIIGSTEERELNFISSINTTAGYEGWIELNVTAAFVSWVNNHDENRGLYITVHPVHRPAHEVRLEDIGLINNRGDDDKQPFMVGFFKANPLNAHLKQSHRLRKSRSKREASKKKKKTDYSLSESRNPLTDSYMYSTRPTRSCQIQTLYVNFKDLQWQDWIIAPDGFGAFYCSGECNFPLNAHMNATNHAIVQTLLHLLDPTKVPKPCCAPTKLIPISVLYFLEDSNVILKKYKNMVVKSCGCH